MIARFRGLRGARQNWRIPRTPASAPGSAPTRRGPRCRESARRDEIPVERIYIDTEPEKVAPYKEMRAFMVISAVYLLDAPGALIDRLQGEMTAERFAKAPK